MTVRAAMCGECPFRRKAPPGWLGANTPEDFVANAIEGYHSVACHTMVNQSLPPEKWQKAEAEAPRCRGALVMMRNECKMPINPELVELRRPILADRENIFSHRNEFIAHHNAAKVKNWEF